MFQQADQGHRDGNEGFCIDSHDWLSPAVRLCKHRRYKRSVMTAFDLDDSKFHKEMENYFYM